MRRALSLAVVASTAIAAAVSASPASAQPAAPPSAPLYTTGSREVPGRYIIVLKDASASGIARATDALSGPMEAVRREGGSVRRQFTTALRGFSADLTSEALASVRRDPGVAFVQTVRTYQATGGGGTQSDAPWDLDRLDQRDLPLSETYTYPDDGAGVNVYVLDTGVRRTHTQFEGRAAGVYDAIRDGNGTNDCDNHGTFVSSHIAGKTYGVAKQANIKAVRILDCNGSGTTEQIVDGMDWAAGNYVRPAVANMSIQSTNGLQDQVMDTAAKGMIDKGLITVFIAGNFNKGDCKNSPKDPRGVIMANSNADDQRHTGGNPSSYGSCVTAFAPGANVTGATKDSDTSTVSGWNGTSFAAPKAAGHIALQLQRNPDLTMTQAKQNIIDTSTKDELSNIGTGSPNRLLFVGGGTSSPDPTVTNPGNQASTLGTAVSLQIRASDPQSETLTYSASGLPAGLSINSSTGVIAGMPTSAGTFTVTITATDPGGHSGSAAFTWTVSSTGGCSPKQLVGNSGFESGTSPWAGNTWTIGSFAEQPAHSGSRVSWLAGYGRTTTESIRQSIAVPSGCKATLSFYLHVDTDDRGTVVNDKFTVKAGSTTLATYSNRDAAGGYTARTFDLSAYAGQTIALTFTGTENGSLQTGFTVDDVTITTN